MTKIAQQLAASRQAHRAGRAAWEKQQHEAAREHFARALASRLAARQLDPEHTDPAWREDLRNLHAGVRWAENRPGIEAQFDAEIERYLRQRLGEDQNTRFQVDLNAPEAAVVVPEGWETTAEGRTPCVTCRHGADAHPPVADGVAVRTACVYAEFDGESPGGVRRCPCPAYVASVCRHVWERPSARVRRCVACRQMDTLAPTMAVEETAAFKQLGIEREKREQREQGRDERKGR